MSEREEGAALRGQVEMLQRYLWRIRDAVMHEGGWCYDYETAEGARIAEAVNTIWREARDAGHYPFAAAATDPVVRLNGTNKSHGGGGGIKQKNPGSGVPA